MPNSTRPNRIVRYFITAPSWQLGVLVGLLTLSLFTSIGLLLGKPSAPGEFAFWILYSVLHGANVARARKQEQIKLSDELGITPTASDTVALYRWRHYARKPQAVRLQPVLSRYVQYLDDLYRGRRLYPDQKAYNQLLIISLLFAVVVFFLIITSGWHWWTVAALLGLLLLFGPPLTSQPGRVNVFWQAANWRHQRRVARMRAQL